AIGPWSGRITHEQLEFVKRLWRDAATAPGHLPDVAAFIARLGDLPRLAVLQHLNLKFPRHLEAHLDRRDCRLRGDIERVGLPFVRDTLTRIEIAMAPRGCREAHEQTPHHARNDYPSLPTGSTHQLTLPLSPPLRLHQRPRA